MPIKQKVVGREVSIHSNDSVEWIDLTVPPSFSATTSSAFAPPAEECASCMVLEFNDPTVYLIWRINKSSPHVLEVLEFCIKKEFPCCALRITFPDALSPFAFICCNECSLMELENPYLLYTLTVSGIAYLVRLNNVKTYTSGTVIKENDFIQFDVRSFISRGVITGAAAHEEGQFLVGTDSGAVYLFNLFNLNNPGKGVLVLHRDDENRAVQDLKITHMAFEVVAVILHSDGIVSVWDIKKHHLLLSHPVCSTSLAGPFMKRLSVGDRYRSIIPLAILHKQNLEDKTEVISIYGIQFLYEGPKVIVSMNGSVQNILFEGQCLDFRFSLDTILILKDDGVLSYDIFPKNVDGGEAKCYALQEEFIADQLFRSSGCFSDDLLRITQSHFSHVEDQTILFISSIFLRKLLHPGVFNDSVFQMAMLDYNRHLTSSELRPLGVDELRMEILSLIEHEANQTPVSALRHWKAFCDCYFDHWCKNNAPIGLLSGYASDAILLIRKSSVSLFRSMEKIELLVAGSDEVNDIINLGLSNSDDDVHEREIISELLVCIKRISWQLGKSASAVIYELLFSWPSISYDDFLPCLLKILETEHSGSLDALNVLHSRFGSVLEKETVHYKNLEKFSVNMLLSLHSLRSKAGAWCRVLEAIEGYIKLLIPEKTMQKFDTERSRDAYTVTLVHSTSQIASVMFESAFDVLLFLSYLHHFRGQIHTSQDDVSRIQFELIPMLQKIISDWLIIHVSVSVPFESPAVEDFCYQLSSLKIDRSIDKRSWKDRQAKCNLTLAFLPLSNGPNCWGAYIRQTDRYLPDPQDILEAVRNCTSWITWGRTEDGSSASLSHAGELAMILIQNGQYKAAEVVMSLARKEYSSRSSRDARGEWGVLHNPVGCWMRAHAHGLHRTVRDAEVLPRAPPGPPSSHSPEVVGSAAAYLKGKTD